MKCAGQTLLLVSYSHCLEFHLALPMARWCKPHIYCYGPWPAIVSKYSPIFPLKCSTDFRIGDFHHDFRRAQAEEFRFTLDEVRDVGGMR